MSKEYNEQHLNLSMLALERLMMAAVRNKRMHFCLLGFTISPEGQPDFIRAVTTFGTDNNQLMGCAAMLAEMAEPGCTAPETGQTPEGGPTTH